MDLPALAHPERLWALAVLPLLWWLSRPPRPRRVVVTPHLTQWLRARARLGRRPVRFPWRRFLLAALAAAATAFAFSGPTVGARPGPTALVVLLDCSASMAAGPAPSPWQRAVQELERQLPALPGHLELELALCGAVPRVHRGAADQLLAALPAQPAGAGGVDLARLAARMLERGAAVWTLTDGLGPSAAPAVGALSLVGEPAPNAGLTGIEIEDGWPLPDIAVTVEVANFLGRPAALQLAAAGGVEPWTASEQLAAGETRRVKMSLRRRDGGRVDIRLTEHRDALAVDDALVLHVPPPAAPDIAVLVDDAAGPLGRREIEAAAAALAAETGGRVVAAQPGSRAGFLLVEGGILPQAPPRALTFGTRRSSGELARDAVVLGPQVVDWDRADPLTRGLDLSELRVAHCLRHDFLGSGKPVLQGAHGPMVTVDEHGEAASVHAAFRLADSNFGRLPAFPQFVRRAFARAFGGRAAPALDPGNLLSAAESQLVRDAGAAPPADRGLPEFGSPGRALAAPLLLLALAALVVRLYT